MVSRFIVLSLLLVGLLTAVPSYTAPARELMEEVQSHYSDARLDEYLDYICQTKVCDDDKRENLYEEVALFFDSEDFLVTGAAYLTALFQEADLLKLLEMIREHGLSLEELTGSESERLRKLFYKLDPYLKRYLKNRL